MIDIYSHNNNNTIFDDADPLSLHIAQMKNILNGVDTGQIMGASEMTADLEEWIFSFNFDEFQLKTKISNLFLNYCTFMDMFITTIDVKFAKGTERDICLIDIFVDNTKMFGVIVK